MSQQATQTVSSLDEPSNEPLLQIRDLQVGFETQRGIVPAVRGVDLTLYAGQTLAIVGESGSGKTTTAQSIIDLLPGTGHVQRHARPRKSFAAHPGENCPRIERTEFASGRGRGN